MTNQQKVILETLSKHPELEARIVELFKVVGDSSSDFHSPDAAEEFLIREIGKLGQELLQGWAADQEGVLAAGVADKKRTTKHGKKKLLGTLPSEK